MQIVCLQSSFSLLLSSFLLNLNSESSLLYIVNGSAVLHVHSLLEQH